MAEQKKRFRPLSPLVSHRTTAERDKAMRGTFVGDLVRNAEAIPKRMLSTGWGGLGASAQVPVEVGKGLKQLATEVIGPGLKAAAPYAIGAEGMKALGLGQPNISTDPASALKGANARALASTETGKPMEPVGLGVEETLTGTNEDRATVGATPRFPSLRAPVGEGPTPELVDSTQLDDPVFRTSLPEGSALRKEFGKEILSDSFEGATIPGARADLAPRLNRISTGELESEAGPGTGGFSTSLANIDPGTGLSQGEAKALGRLRQEQEQKRLMLSPKRATAQGGSGAGRPIAPSYGATKPSSLKLREMRMDIGSLQGDLQRGRLSAKQAEVVGKLKLDYWSKAFGLAPAELAKEMGLNYREGVKEAGLTQRQGETDAAAMARQLVQGESARDVAAITASTPKTFKPEDRYKVLESLVNPDDPSDVRTAEQVMDVRTGKILTPDTPVGPQGTHLEAAMAALDKNPDQAEVIAANMRKNGRSEAEVAELLRRAAAR